MWICMMFSDWTVKIETLFILLDASGCVGSSGMKQET